MYLTLAQSILLYAYVGLVFTLVILLPTVQSKTIIPNFQLIF